MAPVMGICADLKEHRKQAMMLYMKGKYRDVVLLVDALYGWTEGQLDRDYTKAEAKRAMMNL